ncbi:uncharacterized protein LOC118285168 [Scophthalmus maximus]|uniref:uncharacterized protein LOC118285168 n=1 Tax=Scophthalmus maximus TaxID=52904 RepID=UPI0015E120DF|nr:uncharacterized protein LOC118285168 [Scophthalmus maximus]
MRASRVLQLSAWLAGVCAALCHALPTEEAGEVPASQLRMLSLGLAHLLHGVEENAGQLERRGEQAAAELDGVARSLEGLTKQSSQAGRTHRQVRKDLQILSARGDRLRRTVRELQEVLQDLDTEQRATQQRLDRLVHRVQSLTGPRSRGQAPAHSDSTKVLVGKQARRLASLTSEVSARDKVINRRLQRIRHLEKHVRDLGASQGRV